MKAKEKAYELINIYYQKVADSSYPEDLAKQCALILIREIVNTELLKNKTYGYLELNKTHIEYWQEVKKEIENL